MKKMLIIVIATISLLAGCANKNEKVYVTNIIQAADEQDIPVTLFLPPEGSLVTVTLGNNGEPEAITGTLTVITDTFIIVEVSGQPVQIFFETVIDFEVLQLPQIDDDDDNDNGGSGNDDDNDGDDDDDNGNGNGDNDDDDDYSCGHRNNNVHVGWFKKCKKSKKVWKHIGKCKIRLFF